MNKKSRWLSVMAVMRVLLMLLVFDVSCGSTPTKEVVVYTPIPTETPEPTSTPLPTGTPEVIDPLEAAYYAEISSGWTEFGSSIRGFGDLFDNPEENITPGKYLIWRVDVTKAIRAMLIAVDGLQKIPAPDGCEKCFRIKAEFTIIGDNAVNLSSNWLNFMETRELSNIDNMTVHMKEMGGAVGRIIEIRDE